MHITFLHMSANVCVSVYVTYIHIYKYFVRVCIYMSVFLHTYNGIHLYMCMHPECIHSMRIIYIHIYVCTYIDFYILNCVCTYTHVYTNFPYPVFSQLHVCT